MSLALAPGRIIMAIGSPGATRSSNENHDRHPKKVDDRARGGG